MTSTQDYTTKSGTAGLIGDTWHFTAWDHQGSGAFNNGHVYGTYNDGQMPGGVNFSNIGFVELVSYDPNDVNGTDIEPVNGMTSFGGASETGVGYCPMGYSWKSDDPFAIGNTLYLQAHCLNNSGFFTSSSTLITSPDHGLHWCNVSHYLAGGIGGPNTCDSGNWSSAGDVPLSTFDMLWPGMSNTDTSNPMSQAVFAQVCQNQSVNCSSNLTSGPCDPALYVCMNGISGDYTKMYAARAAGDPMILSNWQYWNGTTYQSSLSSAVPVTGLFRGLGVTPSIVYLPDANVYLMQGDNSGVLGQTPAQIVFSTAPNPYGPWTQKTVGPVSIQSNFPTGMLARLVHVGTNHYTLTNAINGSFMNHDAYHVYFQEWDLVNLDAQVLQ